MKLPASSQGGLWVTLSGDLNFVQNSEIITFLYYLLELLLAIQFILYIV